MDVPPALLQIVASLVAILALAALAWKLGLGPRGAPLDSDDAVREAANEAVDGFAPVSIARDREGHAALAADADGRVLLLRAHGAATAGRLLGPLANARADGTTLTVATGERRFGDAILSGVPDAKAWESRIDALS